MTNSSITLFKGEVLNHMDYYRLQGENKGYIDALQAQDYTVTFNINSVTVTKGDSMDHLTPADYAGFTAPATSDKDERGIKEAREAAAADEIDTENKDVVMTLLQSYLLMRKPRAAYSIDSNYSIYNDTKRKWEPKQGSGFSGQLASFWRNLVDAFTSRNTRIVTAKHALSDLSEQYWSKRAVIVSNFIEAQDKRANAMNKALKPYEDNNKNIGGTLGTLFSFSSKAQYQIGSNRPTERNPMMPEPEPTVSLIESQALKKAFKL